MARDIAYRGTKRKPKDVYVLYFEGTKEQEKMNSLVAEIEQTADKYKILNCVLRTRKTADDNP